MKPSSRFEQRAARLTQWVLRVAAAGLVAMTAIIGWQVFARYVLNASPPWTESLALLLMLYYILLAAAIGVREGFHLSVRVLLDNVATSWRQKWLRIIDMLVGLFGVAMILNGLKLAAFTIDHVIPTLGITRAAAYLPFVISGVLIVLFSLERIIRGAAEPGRKPSSRS